METQLDDLLTILTKEVTLHEELTVLLQEEANSIGNSSGSELLQIHSLKMQCVHKVANLEKQRLNVVKSIAEFWNMESQDLTLSIIISGVDVKIAEALQECFDRLKQLMAKIREQSEHNARLSEARLKPIEVSLQFLTDLQKRQKTYSGSGALRSHSSTVSRTAI